MPPNSLGLLGPGVVGSPFHRRPRAWSVVGSPFHMTPKQLAANRANARLATLAAAAKRRAVKGGAALFVPETANGGILVETSQKKGKLQTKTDGGTAEILV